MLETVSISSEAGAAHNNITSLCKCSAVQCDKNKQSPRMQINFANEVVSTLMV